MRGAYVVAGIALIAVRSLGCALPGTDKSAAETLEPPRLAEAGDSLGTQADLRFDGVYVGPVVDRKWFDYHDVLRLFRDGRVISVGIAGSPSVSGTLTVFEGGFGQAIGHYQVIGSTLRFTTRGESVTVQHAALILAGSEPRLSVATRSGSYGERRVAIYRFLPIPGFE